MELCEFMKERWNIHHNIGEMIRGIRLVHSKTQDEWTEKGSNENVE